MKKLLFYLLLIGAAWNAVIVAAAIVYSLFNPYYFVIKERCFLFLVLSAICIVGMIAVTILEKKN